MSRPRRIIHNWFSSLHQASALLFVLALVLSGPAFALRQAGLEENAAQEEFLSRLGASREGKPRTSQVAQISAIQPTTIPAAPVLAAAGMEEWPQLVYHLNRVVSGSNDVKLQALEAIKLQLLQRPNLSQEARDQIVDTLIPLFQKAVDATPQLRGKILRVLAFTAFHHPGVQSLIREVFQNVEKEDAQVVLNGIQGLHQFLDEQQDKDRLLSLKGEITQVVDLILPVLNHSNEVLVQRAIVFIRSVVGGDSPRSLALVEPGTLRTERWLGTLRRLTQEGRGLRIRLDATRILSLLGEDVDPELKKRLEAYERGQIPALIAVVRDAVKESGPSRRLTKTEMEKLSRQIQKGGLLPRDLLRELFQEGKKIVCVNCDDMLDEALLGGIVSDVTSLSQDYTIYLALNLPPRFQSKPSESEPSDFERYLAGEDVAAILQALEVFFGLEGEDTEFARANSVFREKMQLLQPYVRFYFFEPEESREGELAFDQRTDNLVKLVDLTRNDPRARILIYNGPFVYPPFSRVDLTDRTEVFYRSALPALAEHIGSDKVASVLEQTQERWESHSAVGVHNLDEFLDRHPIPTSFGLRLGKTPIDPLRFHSAFSASYAPTWDAIIFRKRDGEEDPDFFLPPEIPKPEPLAPINSAPLVPAAGLEELGRPEVPAWQRALIFGVGNIGRGYLAPMLVRGDDFDVIFVDINQTMIDAVNQLGSYRVVPVGGGEPFQVRNVWGLHALNQQEIVTAQGPRADWIFTAVGTNNIINLTPTLRQYIQRRIDAGRMETLNIVFAENLPIDQPQIEATRQAVLKDADETLRNYVENNVNFIGAGIMDTRFRGYLENEVGFVGAVVQITVPEKKAVSENPLDIQVEGGDYTLVVDKRELKHTPSVPHFMEPVNDIFAYREKKLLIHNMGHAVLAYLSAAKGLADPALGMQDPQIAKVVRLAMEESALGLLHKYPKEFTQEQMRHYIDELLTRFFNQALGDTVERIGQEPLRKLSPQDRLFGAAANALAAGHEPKAITLGIAAAVRYARVLKIPEEQLIPVIQEAHRLGLALPDNEETFQLNLNRLTSGLEESVLSIAKAKEIIQSFADRWKLTDSSDLHLVGITPEAIEANPFLQILQVGPVSIGDVVLVMIPEQESERVNVLLPFMDEPRGVSVVGYQGLQGDGKLVDAFLQTAGRMGLNPRRLGDQESQAFRVFFRQLIHNISGIPLESIRPDDLVDFERALSRLRST